MKINHLLAAVVLILSYTMVRAQIPQGIPYQAIIRDSINQPLPNQNCSLRFSLHNNFFDGPIVYQETHNTVSSALGLVSLNFGSGVPSIGAFSQVNWGLGYKFLEVEVDLGSEYVIIGNQQLMSVPYALYAGNGANSNSTAWSWNSQVSMISNPSLNQLNFYESINYCVNLIEGGYDDWHLPTSQQAMDFLNRNGIPETIYLRTTSPYLGSLNSSSYSDFHDYYYKIPSSPSLVYQPTILSGAKITQCVR